MKILPLLLLFGVIFNSDIEEVDIKNINNSVIIICDNLICKDCLQSINKIQHIWKQDYRTVVITKSRRNKKVTNTISEYYKSQMKFDDIYFVESAKYFGFSSLVVGNNKFNKTPSIIIKSHGKENVIMFDSLFPKDYDTTSIKKIILQYLK